MPIALSWQPSRKDCPFLQVQFAKKENVCAHFDGLCPDFEPGKNGYGLGPRALYGAASMPTNADQMPALFWPFLLAAGAALMMLIAYHFGLLDLGRLLPDGVPFIPYYTT
jgi:hypothetical protein